MGFVASFQCATSCRKCGCPAGALARLGGSSQWRGVVAAGRLRRVGSREKWLCISYTHRCHRGGTTPPPSPAPPDVSPHTARGWGGMAVRRPRLPSAPCWGPCAASLPVAASCTPEPRVCTRLSRRPSAAPPALQELLYQSLQALIAFESVPSSRPGRARRPVPPPVLSVPCGAGGGARWCGAPRARPGGGLARVGGRGRWKRPFDFPILPDTMRLIVDTFTRHGVAFTRNGGIAPIASKPTRAHLSRGARFLREGKAEKAHLCFRQETHD